MIYFPRIKKEVLHGLPAELLSEFEKPVFTVQDTGFTYRQINNLDNGGILVERRNEGKGWRKFDYYDLIFLKVLGELKRLGYDNKQLLEFSRYYQESDELKKATRLAFLGDLIVLSVDQDVNVSIYSWEYYTALAKYDKTSAVINLHELIEETKKLEAAQQLISWFKGKYKLWDSNKLSEKEMELIAALRDSNYTEIRVKRAKDGKVVGVYAREQHVDRTYSEKETLEIIRTLDWADIHIKKENGKIVFISAEEIFK